MKTPKKSVKITKKWLDKHGACEDGRAWWEKSGLTDHREIALQLLKEKEYAWVNWMLVRLMDHKDKVRYAIRAGNQTLPIFEKKCPNDKRPRVALETARKWLNGKATREECRTAAVDAYAAAYAAYAANAAANAANAANAAANAATTTADAGYAAACAAYAATTAADAGYAAADAAKHKYWTGQIKYGLSLIQKATK